MHMFLKGKISEAMEQATKVNFTSNVSDFERTKNIAEENALFTRLCI